MLFICIQQGILVKISTETEKWIRRILKMKFSKYFCISIILLTQIMGKCCGPYEFFYLRGQYYGLGHPNLLIAKFTKFIWVTPYFSKYIDCNQLVNSYISNSSNFCFYFISLKIHFTTIDQISNHKPSLPPQSKQV